MDINLILLKKNGDRKEFPLLADATTIGRRSDCDLILRLMEVSRRHCQVHRDGSKLILRDLGSSNGTTVNGNKIEDQVQLNPGDVMQIGPVRFAVQIDGIPGDFSIIGGDSDNAETKTAQQVTQKVSEEKAPPPPPKPQTKPKAEPEPAPVAIKSENKEKEEVAEPLSSSDEIFSIDGEPDSAQILADKVKNMPSLEQLAASDSFGVQSLDSGIDLEKSEPSSSDPAKVTSAKNPENNVPLPDDDIFGDLPDEAMPKGLSESDLFKTK